MEEIEQTVLNTYLKLPSLWVRYVDDVYAIMEKTEVESFHNYLLKYSIYINKFSKELEKIRKISLFGCKCTTVER